MVAPATKASVLPASYQVAPMASARDAGTSTWSLHDTQAKPARSAARPASISSAPPTSRSQGWLREGICCTPGRPTPKRRISHVHSRRGSAFTGPRRTGFPRGEPADISVEHGRTRAPREGEAGRRVRRPDRERHAHARDRHDRDENPGAPRAGRAPGGVLLAPAGRAHERSNACTISV